jgi:DNA mismatch repair ATPase MutS
MSLCLSYKLVPGVSKRSYGTACAVAAGVPERVMLRASHVANDIASNRVSRSTLALSAIRAPEVEAHVM